VDGACYDAADSGNVGSCRGGDFSTFLNTGGSSSVSGAVGINANIASDTGTGNISVGDAVLGAFHNYAFTQPSGMVTIKRAFGVQAGVTLTGQRATISTGYGVYIDRVDATHAYGLYQADPAASSYFAGSVGIGVPTPTYPLEAASGAGLTRGGAWLDAADGSQQENVGDVGYGLAEILQLRPHQFIPTGETVPRLGLTAQDVDKVIPESVFGQTGRKSVSNGALVAVLIRAVQEQQAEIATLREQVHALQH
jgi:hypothetical protein